MNVRLVVCSPWIGLAAVLALTGVGAVRAQIPTVLTDRIYQGSGVIDLMKDATDTQLTQYIGANGRLLLGVDVNENASGNESSTSQGIALKSVELLITTSQGSFSFSDIFTNTTATITAAGSTTAQNYYTLFGQGGSSQVNGSTTGFDLSKFDDVLEVRNVAVTGVITSARLQVNFLETAGQEANATFFDFSGGFEDFALLAPQDAQVLEAAAIGTTGASSELTFSTTTVSTTYYTQPSPAATAPTTSTTTSSTSTGTSPTAPPPATAPVLSAPGAPEPPLALLVGGAILALVAASRERLARRA